MLITLNGASIDTATTTLAELLAEQALTGQLATARNGDFVPHALRAQTMLAEHDRIEVLAPMQGG